MVGPGLVLALADWWLRRLRRSVRRSLVDWAREPEWPLLWVAAVSFGSFFLHGLGYQLAKHQVGWPSPLFREPEWEGRVGWRKPMVFGISTAMVFASLREALRSQDFAPRGALAHLAAWSTAAEVGIITLQAWR